MPRAARIKSNSGYYHILLRGVARQNIFEDDFDRVKFMDILRKYKDELNFEINAYCLMDNHIHLLIKDTKQQIELIMKKITVSYAYHFNFKYDRVGHFFQDRFKSEPIEDENYFITAIRYIHQNPYKVGIGATENYKWSSYSEYMVKNDIVDTAEALELLNGKEGFSEFHKIDEEQDFIDVFEIARINDEAAMEIIKNTAQTTNVQSIQTLNKNERNQILSNLKNQGLSIRQIARLTGISRGIVLKA